MAAVHHVIIIVSLALYLTITVLNVLLIEIISFLFAHAEKYLRKIKKILIKFLI